MRLDRAGHLQEVGVGIGQHVGRHRQRQHQRPVEQALAREAVHGDQPGGTRRRAPSEPAPTPRQSSDAVAQILGQDGAGEMRPQALGRLADEAEQGQQRGGHDQAEQRREPCAAPGQQRRPRGRAAASEGMVGWAMDIRGRSRSTRRRGPAVGGLIPVPGAHGRRYWRRAASKAESVELGMATDRVRRDQHRRL